MIKLINANLRRLLKSKILYIDMIVCGILSLYIVFANYSPEIQAGESPVKINDVFFIMYQIFEIIISAAIGLEVGTEYSDGTIRNKIIVGHTRRNIYFATLFTNIISTLILILTHTVITLIPAILLFKDLGTSVLNFVAFTLCSMLALLCMAALFSAICMNCSNRAVSSVIAIVISIFLILGANAVGSKLAEPEMTYDGITITVEGGVQFGEYIKNPAYLEGTKRDIYQFVYNLLPTGQIMQICSDSEAELQILAIMSVASTAFYTAVGYVLFNKKDIK